MEDANERVPCIDEMCTGVLDAKGVCGTCGKQGDVSLLERIADEDASGPDAAEAADARGDSVAVEAAPASDDDESRARDDAGEHALEPSDRVPCSDDMCTGIIGADGKCGTCGKPA
jgi:hypothetical protein